MQPTELFSIDAIFADNEAPEPERVDLEKALPAKARRGRKPKASSAPETAEADVSATGMTSSDHPKSTGVEDVDLTPEATPVKARRKRKIDGQPSLPEAALQADPIDDAVEIDASLVSQADVGALTETPSAAEWNAATGTISFDWPAIEQTAGTEGPNQAMAKLLLAARDEGANSRWPFKPAELISASKSLLAGVSGQGLVQPWPETIARHETVSCFVGRRYRKHRSGSAG